MQAVASAPAIKNSVMLCARILLVMLLAAILFLDTGSDDQTDQHTEGDADAGMIPERGADGCAEAHPQAHPLCSVISLLFFLLSLPCAFYKKHRKEQAHRDPRQCRPKKIKYCVHLIYTPFWLFRTSDTSLFRPATAFSSGWPLCLGCLYTHASPFPLRSFLPRVCSCA